jgi:hypothetical protein
MIICGSFPTLHRFLRQVAPGLIGESSGKSNDQPAGNLSLRTFGDSGPRKRGYDKFGESDGNLELIALDRDE